MFKKSFPFCLNHLWASTFSICSTENGTTLYCAWKAVCVGGIWVISHVNGWSYCQFSIFYWQWLWFHPKTGKIKVHLITTFCLFNIILHIFMFFLLLFSNYLVHFSLLLYLECKLPEDRKWGLYFFLNLHRQDMEWRQLMEALRKPMQHLSSWLTQSRVLKQPGEIILIGFFLS